MLFCSREFFYFFTLVFALYWAIPWRQARVWLLLIASFYFYASWNHWLAGLICLTTLGDYLLALRMEAVKQPLRRKFLLGVSLVGNLGLLVYFKYANFFLQSVEQSLHFLGHDSSLPLLQVMLPIGISFYTFEAINYTVDVYRRKVPAERNLAHFMLFITFFPHLVAGPIVRARHFLPQIRRSKRWSWMRAQLGLYYLVVGLFKKMVIADRMALFADPVFANPGFYSSFAVQVAVLAYALQIYCDFSGYSDMALGSAHLLGYHLARNFDLPYLSQNVSEFWRRWHISLSSWLRDYLFIPLGGSRGLACPWQQARRTNRNLLITMTLGGLWHGASWTFVVWGLLHGLFLIVHRTFREWCARLPRLDRLLQSSLGVVLRIGFTFWCVSLAWVFFRAPTLPSALVVLKRALGTRAGLPAPLPYASFFWLLAVVLLCHLLARLRQRQWWLETIPAPVIGLSCALVVTLALVLAPDSGKAFIYFQF
jgi:alginate O-acetyltransferase complex protein AlgI